MTPAVLRVLPVVLLVLVAVWLLRMGWQHATAADAKELLLDRQAEMDAKRKQNDIEKLRGIARRHRGDAA